jgi:hypothetical protein
MKLLFLLLMAYPVMAQEIIMASLVRPASLGALQAEPLKFQAKPWFTFQPEPQTHDGRAIYRWSLVTLLAANGADAVTSWQRPEVNPILGSSGRFDGTSVAIKAGMVGATLLVQHVILRHRPDLQRKMAWFNFTASGVLGAAAFYNSALVSSPIVSNQR